MGKLFNYGPLAKLDKALGYEPGDSRFEFWAVHQKRWIKNVRLATKIISTKISYIFFHNCFYNFVNFNFCIIKKYEQ
jgi:hypothetical protein